MTDPAETTRLLQAIGTQGSRLTQHEATLTDLGANLQVMSTQPRSKASPINWQLSQTWLQSFSTNPHLRCNPLTTVSHAFQLPNGTMEISVPAAHFSHNAPSYSNINPIHLPATDAA